MGGVLAAIEAANALLTLLGNGVTAIAQINSTIAAAQAAGRDLTDAELQGVINTRKAAEQSLQQALGLPAA